MYEPEDDYMQEEHDSDEIITEMWQESAWITITAFFEEKGTEDFVLLFVMNFFLEVESFNRKPIIFFRSCATTVGLL